MSDKHRDKEGGDCGGGGGGNEWGEYEEEWFQHKTE